MARFQPQTLDVDESLLDNSLRFLEKDPEQEQLEAILGTDQHTKKTPVLSVSGPSGLEMPSVEVTPEPGLCLKTKNISGSKVFVNICKVMEIPPPMPITEQELQRIIADEDYTTDYRIPMSLGAPLEDKDKSGSKCLVCDVAVNGLWYDDTMVDNITFTTFTIHVAFEGLCEKYGDQLNLDRQNWTILKNKRYFGQIRRHNIQQRAAGNQIKELDQTPSSVNSPITLNKRAELVKPIPLRTQPVFREQTPQYKLLKHPADSENPVLLTVEVEVPGVNMTSDMRLDIGEDRIVMEARRAGLLLDIFVPFCIDQEHSEVCATFKREKKLLVLNLPLVA